MSKAFGYRLTLVAAARTTSGVRSPAGVRPDLATCDLRELFAMTAWLRNQHQPGLFYFCDATLRVECRS